MVKVLVLLYSLQVADGVASFAMNYFRSLDHRKVQMDFAVYSGDSSTYHAEIRQKGGKVFVLPGIKNMEKHLQACRMILEQGQYDVIHDNTLHITIPMMMCAMHSRVPVRILHSHSSKLSAMRAKEIRNKVFLPMLRCPATDYLACSSPAGKLLFGNRPFAFVPNVIAADQFCFREEKRNEVRLKMGVGTKCVVGSVGRLAAEKNPFFAMDVFQAFLARRPDAEYWWAGDGPLSKEVEQYVQKKGLSRSVRLLGSRTDVADLYQAMDVLLFPSRFEGLGITGVEAQAMGLPVVVSDMVPKEMDYTGLVDRLCLNETPERWAEQLEKAAVRQVDRGQYATALQNSCYSDVGCGERLTKLYKQLLEQRLNTK